MGAILLGVICLFILYLSYKYSRAVVYQRIKDKQRNERLTGSEAAVLIHQQCEGAYQEEDGRWNFTKISFSNYKHWHGLTLFNMDLRNAIFGGVQIKGLKLRESDITGIDFGNIKMIEEIILYDTVMGDETRCLIRRHKHERRVTRCRRRSIALSSEIEDTKKHLKDLTKEEQDNNEEIIKMKKENYCNANQRD